MKRRLIAALTLSASPALADSVTDMCLDMGGTTNDQCICATEALPEAIGEEETELYSKVGTLFIANKAAGQGMADAWDAALGVVAAELETGRTAFMQRMNEAGSAHREAVETCG